MEALKTGSFICALGLAVALFGCAAPAGDNIEPDGQKIQEAEIATPQTQAPEPRATSPQPAVPNAADQTSRGDTEESPNSQETGEAAMLETSIYDIQGVPVTMILVEAGTFTMGSDAVQTALAEHEETIDHDFLMAEIEVTEALWNAVMGQGGGSDNLPKTSVTWPETFDFLERLNEIAHEKGVIPTEAEFYLPSEAEWEYAAIGGNQSQGYTYAGGNDIDAVAETQENSGTHPVAVKGKAPNELGLYDMSGNAYEWVNAQEGSGYVKKGGSNYHSFSAEPYLYTPQGRYIYSSTDWTIGFRIALR